MLSHGSKTTTEYAICNMHLIETHQNISLTLIDHFTVVYLVAKPLIWSEAEGDQYLVSMITK